MESIVETGKRTFKRTGNAGNSLVGGGGGECYETQRQSHARGKAQAMQEEIPREHGVQSARKNIDESRHITQLTGDKERTGNTGRRGNGRKVREVARPKYNGNAHLLHGILHQLAHGGSHRWERALKASENGRQRTPNYPGGNPELENEGTHKEFIDNDRERTGITKRTR